MTTGALAPRRVVRRTPTVNGLAGVVRPSWDPLRISLFLLTALTVSRIHQHFSFLAALRPAILLVALTGAYAVMNPRLLAADSLFRTWPARVMGALAVLACGSAVFGIAQGRAGIYVIESYSKVLIFAFLLIAAIRSVRDMAVFVWGYVTGCAILVWLSLFVFELEKNFGSEAYRLNDLYSFDANDVGCVLMIGIGLTLWTFQASRAWGKALSVVIMVGIGATIAKTGSRGAFVGLVVVGLYLMFALKSVSPMRRGLLVAIVTTALIVSAPPG